MSFTKRTCTSCGYRDIQPNMVQTEIEYQSGSSIKGITGREAAGWLLGSKTSEKAVNKWLFSPNKRNYTRKRKVWLCDNCAKQAGGSSFSWFPVIGAILVLWFLISS